jgi:hypothetical protein
MTAATEPNVLHCTDRIFISSRGWLYMGPAPFAFRKNDPAEMAMVMQRPWVIDHPDCAPAVWRAVGLDSYATWDVRQGSTIGLLVEPWYAAKSRPLAGPQGSGLDPRTLR